MATRITYKEMRNRPGVLESVKKFVSSRTGAAYLVRINTNDMTYEIKNIKTEVIYRGGENISNLNHLKKAAKQRLAGMGVVFNQEDRNRSFGLCTKGYNQDIHVRRLMEDLK